MAKKLQELTLKDNFMFTAVMIRPENCKGMLERVLGIPIERVEVSLEKCLIYHPEYKGVRLDVYAKDEANTHYNVEMQAVRKGFLGKRSRYYTSQMDMEILSAGLEYSELHELEQNFEDEYVKQLQDSIKEIKVSREMGARYVVFQEMLRDERKAGKIEGCVSILLELLEELGDISSELYEKIQAESNLDELKRWTKLAAKSESIEDFQNNM